MKKGSFRKILELISITLLILIVLFFIYSITNYSLLREKFSAEINIYGLPALFLLSVFLEIIPQFALAPAGVLITGLVAGLNAHLAVVFTITGSLIGSIVGFWMGEKYAFKIVKLLVNEERIEKTKIFFNKRGRIAVIIAAISPVPYIPLVLGALKMSRKNFIIYGLLPRTIGIVISGYFTAFILP